MTGDSSTTSNAFDAIADASFAITSFNDLPPPVSRRRVGPDLFGRLKAPVERRYVSAEFEQRFVGAGRLVDAVPDEMASFALVHQA